MAKPAVRFTGFNDDWKKYYLGEIGKAHSGIGFPDSEQGGTSGIPFFKVSDMNIVENENEMLIANNYVSNQQINSHKWLPIKALPAIFFAKVGAAVMLNRKRLCRFPFLLDNNTMAYSLNNNTWNSDFAKALFETIDLTSLTQVGALPSYNASDIQAIQVNLPKKVEQQKIGAFFSTLDKLITLSQRKYDKLVNIKKVMLTKMFPRDGAKVPEIRFKGFAGDWEEHTFQDIIDIKSGKDYKHLSSGNIPVYGTGGYMLSVDKALSLNENAIGIGRKGTIDKPYILVAPFWTVDTLFYAIPKKIHDLNFIFAIFQKINWKRKDESTGVPSLSKTIINSTEANLPSYQEQQKIGNFFTNLDNLIALHQQKLAKLKNIKKACLEKMFV